MFRGRIRRYVGEKIIGLGVRILGDAILAEDAMSPEEEDDDGPILPVVQLNERARAMVHVPTYVPPEVEVLKPLIGSLADRDVRLRAGLGR